MTETAKRGRDSLRQHVDSPAAAVIMGVSGAGKSTIGEQLAKRLGWRFDEGDALHPPKNVAKMKRGQPLTDADRAPWLAAVAQVIDGWRRHGERGVITCSALKRAYRRQIIGDHDDVRLVYLEGSRELIAARVGARQSHFMPPSLLDSQFATLEPPGPDENPITVGINRPVESVVESIIRALASSAQSPQSARSNLGDIQ
jgi:carbohydrate kinase (thermoresistant glucokinase family)